MYVFDGIMRFPLLVQLDDAPEIYISTRRTYANAHGMKFTYRNVIMHRALSREPNNSARHTEQLICAYKQN